VCLQRLGSLKSGDGLGPNGLIVFPQSSGGLMRSIVLCVIIWLGLAGSAVADDAADCKSTTINPPTGIAACSRLLRGGQLNLQGRVMAHSLRARFYAKEGKYELALRDNMQAVQLDPSNANGYASRCLTYVRKGEFDLAIADCSSALEINPNYAFAYGGRAAAYFYKRDYARCIEDASRSIALDPKLSSAWHVRGRAYAELGQIDRGLVDIGHAINTEPKAPLPYNGRGLLLAKKGQHQRALDDFSRSIALNAKEAEPFANRAELYWKLGQRDRAIQDARMVLALPATAPLARDAQVRAAELITQLTLAPSNSAPQSAWPTNNNRPPAAPPIPALPGGTVKRVALVIGNSSYSGVGALRNPVNDGRAIAAAFRGVGFTEVVERYDLPLGEMSQVLKDFGDRTNGADWAVVYYAGHGMEMNGAAYLLPVDAKLEKDTHVNDETIALDRVLEKVEGARRLKLVILDACRNNPFIARMARSASSTRSIGRGLPALEPEGDVLVAYATKHGTTALDGEGANSPYAKALVEHIPAPNVDIRVMFGRVRDTVRKTTRNLQEPYTYGSIGGDLHFLVAVAAR
jgi:tetratricopeptide (TPR) repeat protein